MNNVSSMTRYDKPSPASIIHFPFYLLAGSPNQFGWNTSHLTLNQSIINICCYLQLILCLFYLVFFWDIYLFDKADNACAYWFPLCVVSNIKLIIGYLWQFSYHTISTWDTHIAQRAEGVSYENWLIIAYFPYADIRYVIWHSYYMGCDVAKTKWHVIYGMVSLHFKSRSNYL